MITIFLFILLFLSLVYQLVLWYFLRISSFEQDIKDLRKNQPIPVSIVICSYNSYHSLRLNLKSILDQKYPEFELIIVNDGNDSLTDEYICELSHSFSNLRQIKLAKTSSGKKKALEAGIKTAKYDWILLTDMDCRPMTQLWIQSMVYQVAANTKIVLGYSPYKLQSGLLNHFIRFEAVLNAILYFSMARLGFPYMAVGRNVLYHKSIFKYEDLVPEHVSGDDDLLINRKANPTNTKICLDSNSFMLTDAKKSWKGYFNQRRRHYSSSKYYSIKSQVFLFFNSFSLIALFSSSIGLLLLGTFWIPVISIVIYLFVSGNIYFKNSKILDPNQNVLLYPFLSLIYIGFLILQAPLLLFQKKSW